MNNVTLLGRLVKDVELINKENTVFLKNTIAVEKTGSKDKQVNFIPFIAFNSTAELIYKYCAKGKRIVLEGMLNSSSYEKDNKKIYSLSLIVNSVHFIDYKDFPKEIKLEEKIEGFDELDEELPF